MQTQHSKMTLQEKLDLIDEELKKVHLCCTMAGYTASEIERFAHPFFKKDANRWGFVSWTSVKAWKRNVALIVVLIFLFYYPPAYRAICGITRLGANEILPAWFWTNDDCLVQNPLYEPPSLTIGECETCEMTEEVERLHNLDSDSLKKFRQQNKPVIVEDASINWVNNSNITIAQLAEMYNTHPVLKVQRSCDLRTNVRGTSFEHIAVLNRVVAENIDRFYLHWRSCDISAAKVLRQIYTLPYFLPPAFTPPHDNWILISSNYSGTVWKPLNFSKDLLLVIQLKGQNLIDISSDELCKTYCPTLQATLHQGEVLVVPHGIWNVEYLPSNSPENIAVVVEVGI